MGLTGEEKKEYQREYMRRKRSNKEGLTEDGSNKEGLTGRNAIIPEGVTSLFWYTDGKREELKEVPEGCKVLSDGQVWRPGNDGYHG